jgi:hypothetical protein
MHRPQFASQSLSVQASATREIATSNYFSAESDNIQASLNGWLPVLNSAVLESSAAVNDIQGSQFSEYIEGIELSHTTTTIVFIDSAVDDYQTLVNGVIPEAEVIVLDPNQDGVLAIAQALQGRSNITSVHIVSHGAPGCLYLGNTQLSLDTFNRYATQLQQWDVANLLLYGCNVAAGDAGAEFIAKLHQLTGANIAASRTPTGNSALGGNWQLEVVLGQEQPLLAFPPSVMAAYKGILSTTNNFTQPSQYIFGASHYSFSPQINLTFSDTTTSSITATDSGWVSAQSNGSFSYDNSNTNFFAGFYSFSGEYRNYFLFDIASLTGKTVTSATVTFPSAVWTTTPDSSESYELFDFDESFYQNGGLVGDGKPIHDDLITGQKYFASPYIFNESSDSQSFSRVLSTGAITDLNQAISKGDSLFGMGGAVTTLSGLNLNQPTDLSLSNTSIDENIAAGSTVGTFSTTDLDTSDTFTYSLVTGEGSTDNSAFSIVGNQLRINASPDFETKDSYSIRVRTTDQGGLSYEEVVTVNLNNLNEAPTVANAITNQTATEDAVFSFTIPNSTFADVDGDSLTYTASLENGDALPSWLTFNATTKTFSGTPENGDVGSLSVKVIAADGSGATAEDIFILAIANTNDAPSLTGTPAVLIAGEEDTSYTIKAADLLAGFSDVDGDTLSVSDLSATNGSLVKNNNDTYTFTPTANFNGTVNLNYNVVDGNGGSTEATQSFTLAAVNDAATLTGTKATLTAGSEDTVYTISQSDLLAGFTDVDGDILSVSNLTASNGSLVNNNNGTWSFTPAANYNGSVNLSYNVVDGKGGSTEATQSFTLAAVNDAATLTGTPATLSAGSEDTVYTISQTDLLTGFSDVEGDSLSASNLTASNGSLVNNNNGTWSFTPTANYNGSVNLSYNVTDGNGGSTEATQSFTLSAVNDTPTATNESLTTAEDVPLVISTASLLGNDADVDLGDSLSISAVTQPSKGGLVDNGNGTYTYTPNANYNGTDSFTYTISDRDGATSTATVNLTVNAVNDNPDAVHDIVTARQGTPKTILAAELLANDTDVEGNTLSLTNVSNAQNGTVALDNNGNVVFTANTNASTASFEYTLSDGNGGTDSAIVSVLVGTTLNGGNGKDSLSGTAGDDILNGGNGDDILLGLTGDDILSGDNGMDNLQGGEGKDRLYGGRGNDLLTGGLRSDIFVLMTQSGTDTIQDFADGEDKIGLAGGLTFGQLTIGSSNGNTLISKNGGEVLAILADVNSSLITQADFTSVM